MAKKGQKFLKYTEAEKKEIVELYKSGVASSHLLKTYGIPQGTIKTWKYKIDHPEKFMGKKRGRPKESEIDYKERYEILKKYQAFLKVQRERK